MKRVTACGESGIKNGVTTYGEGEIENRVTGCGRKTRRLP